MWLCFLAAPRLPCKPKQVTYSGPTQDFAKQARVGNHSREAECRREADDQQAQRDSHCCSKAPDVAINDRERSPIAPDVPYPSLLASPVLGLLGPRDMPIALRKRIGADVLATLDDKASRKRLVLMGQPVTSLDVNAYTAALNEQYTEVAHLASVLGIVRNK
jgi:hypothetical protein